MYSTFAYYLLFVKSNFVFMHLEKWWSSQNLTNRTVCYGFGNGEKDFVVLV